MRLSRICGWWGLATLVSAAAVGQEPTGPATSASPGVPSAVRCYVAADSRFPKEDARNRQDRMHCFVCEQGLNPVVAVFARTVPKDADSPLAKLVKAVEPLTVKYRGDRFAAFVLFLRTEPGMKEVVAKQPDGTEAKATLDKEYPDDGRIEVRKDDKAKDKVIFARETELAEVRAFAAATAAPQIPFGLLAATSKATTAFGIPDDPKDADITVVAYNRLFIARKWNFPADKPPGDEDFKAVVAAAEGMIAAARK